MKKVIVLFCAFVALVFAGCNSKERSNWTIGQYYMYSTYVELSDPTYEDPAIIDPEGAIEALIFKMLNDEELAGRVYFEASDPDIMVVDAMLVKLVNDKYAELLPGVRAVDYASMLAVSAPFFRGKVKIVYYVRNMGDPDEGKYIKSDVIDVITLTLPVVPQS